jgi:processive 1,2-diacylglycerol beta-glucosyltransferase
MRTPFRKVLVLSASAGAGHTRAAQAIEKALIEMNAAQEVRHIDILDYTNKLFHKLYSDSYIEMVNKAPKMLGWLYDRFDTPYKNERLRLAFNKLNTGPFVRLLEQYQPDIAICTHFLPSEIISWLKSKKRLSCPQAIVITDFDAHAMWFCHYYEQYFVALDETRAYLEACGVSPEKISISGIPIDPVFAIHKDKKEMRKKYGLKADRPTILLSAGGFGVGPIEGLIKALYKLEHSAQVIAICGRNEELKKRIEKLSFKNQLKSNLLVKAVGYTKEMDEYMAASDMILGKPGGLTTSEALAKGLVFIIVNPIPGQEERNSDHLLEQRVAIRCNNIPILAYKIDKLLDQPKLFAEMQTNTRKLAHPRAAFDIVSKLLELKKEIGYSQNNESQFAPFVLKRSKS